MGQRGARPREDAKEEPARIGERQASLENSWLRWVFLTGNRFVVAGGVLAGVAIVTGAVAFLVPGVIREPSPLFYVFGGLIGGNLTLITVVISINQLVLSRELEAPGKLEKQLDDMREYRDKIATATDRDVLPYLPPDFMYLLLEATAQEARTLEEAVETADTAAQQEVSALAAAITEHADAVTDRLEAADVRPFKSLATTLNADYAAYVHDAERLRATHDAALSQAATDQLGVVVDRIRDLDVAREYFKTLFLQEELAYLSRVLLYVGLPAEISSVSMLLLFATSPAGGLPTQGIPLLVTAAVTIGFAPLAVLFAFVIRLTTITQHTAPILPFGMPGQEP